MPVAAIRWGRRLRLPGTNSNADQAHIRSSKARVPPKGLRCPENRGCRGGRPRAESGAFWPPAPCLCGPCCSCAPSANPYALVAHHGGSLPHIMRGFAQDAQRNEGARDGKNGDGNAACCKARPFGLRVCAPGMFVFMNHARIVQERRCFVLFCARLEPKQGIRCV